MKRRETKDLTHSPLFELLNARNTCAAPPKGLENTPENSLLPLIPSIDKPTTEILKQEAQKGIDFSVSLKNHNLLPQYDINSLRTITQARNPKAITDTYAFITCYYTLSWVRMDPRSRPLESFNILITCLNDSAGTHLSRLVFICFSLFLQVSMAIQELKWEPETIEKIIIQLYSNQAIDMTFFPLMMAFFGVVIDSGHRNCIHSMLTLLDGMIETKRQCINFAETSKIALLIQGFCNERDQIAMRIICRLTQFPNSKTSLDILLLIPTSLSQFIAEKVIPNEVRIELPEKPFESITASISYRIATDVPCRLHNGVLQPPFDAFEALPPIADIMANDVLSTCVNIAESLKIASREGITKFFETLVSYLKILPNSGFINFASAMFIILDKLQNVSIIAKFAPMALNSKLFSPTATIFQGLDPEISSIRMTYLSLLNTYDPGSLLSNVLTFKSWPYLFIESIMRLIELESFSITNFLNEDFLEALIQTSLYLQTVPCLPIVRSSATYILTELCLNSKTSAKILNSDKFIGGYLHFCFEKELSNGIISTLGNAISEFGTNDNLTVLISALQTILGCCFKDPKSNLEITRNLFSSVVEGIHHAEEISIQFAGLLDSVFDYLDLYPDEKIFKDSLTLQNAIVRYTLPYEFSVSRLYQLNSIIHKIYDDHAPLEIQNSLFAILGALVGVFSESLYIIVVPSIIPLIISIFSYSDQFKTVLKRFAALCTFSDSNKRACHDGDLDFILCSIMRQRDGIFKYSDLQIHFKVEESLYLQVILPLVIAIGAMKSNNSIPALISGYISKQIDVELCKSITDYCDRSAANPKPLCILGDPDVSANITGMTGAVFNSNFSIHFSSRLDIPAVGKVTPSIISFTDAENSVLRIFVEGSMYYVKYEAGDARTTVPIVKFPIPNQWQHYTIVFNHMNDKIRISTFCESESLNDSDLCLFKFSEGPIKVEIGGREGPKSVAMNVGLLGPVLVYQKRLVSKDVSTLVKKPWLFTDTPIQYQVLAPLRPPPSLLRTFIKGEHCNILANFFRESCTVNGYSSLILSLLSSIFSTSLSAQKSFTSTGIILSSLYKNQGYLSYSLYISIYQTLQSITHPPLMKTWFESLVTNTWLWSYCPDFLRVIKHWSSVLVSEYPQLFVNTPYFARFVAQLKLFFCDDTRLPAGAIDISKTFPQETISQCREVFVLFLKRIGFLNLTSHDLSSLFLMVRGSSSRASKLILLDVILSISQSILKCKDFEDSLLINIHSLLTSKDLDIIEQSVYILHELSVDKTIQHFFIASIQLQNTDPSDVFNRLIPKIDSYPNLIYLLSFVAVKAKKISEFSQQLPTFASNEQFLSRLCFSPFWFVGLFIIGLNASSPEERASIFSFVSSAFSHCQNPAESFRQLLFLIRFISFISPLPDLLYVLLDSVANNQNVAKEYAAQCFNSTFFHFSSKLHSISLMKEFTQSPFPFKAEEKSERSYLQASISDLSELQTLILYDISILSFFYELKTDEEMHLIDLHLAQAAVISPAVVKEQRDILSYFVAHPKGYDIISQGLTEFFSSNLPSFAASFKATFNTMIIDLRKLLEASRKSVNDIEAMPPPDIQNLFEAEFAKSKGFLVDLLKEEVSFAPDKCLCSLYCPMKLKRKHKAPKIQMPEITSPALAEFKGSLVNYQNCREVIFKLFSDKVILSSQYFAKSFPISIIRLVLTRIFKKESGVEFFLADGRSYLIDFDPEDSSTIIRSLSRATFSEFPVVQNKKSAQLFASLGFTSQWSQGLISNFDYIMKLNIYSGRSFDRIACYPIAPAVAMASGPTSPADIYFPKGDAANAEKSYASRVDAAYSNRRLLESYPVTSNLNRWIDSVWGSGMPRSGTTHSQLFTKSHPPHSGVKVEKRIAAVKETSEGKIIEFSTLLKEAPGEYEIQAFVEDGSSVVIPLNGEEKVKKSFYESGDFIKFASQGRITAIFSNNQLSIVTDGTTTKKSKVLNEVKELICNELNIWAITDGCEIHNLSESSNEIYRSEQRMVAVAASSRFKIFAYSTVACRVHVCSTRLMSEVNSVGTEEEVQKILITELWGFVIAKTKSKLYLITADGFLLKKAEFKEDIVNWFTFSSASGFDYIVYENGEHKVCFFEAYYPEQRKAFHECRDGLSIGFYDAASASFALLSKRGRFEVVPQSLSFV